VQAPADLPISLTERAVPAGAGGVPPPPFALPPGYSAYAYAGGYLAVPAAYRLSEDGRTLTTR